MWTYSISVLEPEVKVLDVQLKIGQDKLNSGQSLEAFGQSKQATSHLFPDLLPDDPRHLVAIQLYHRVFHSNLFLYQSRTGSSLRGSKLSMCVMEVTTNSMVTPHYPAGH